MSLTVFSPHRPFPSSKLFSQIEKEIRSLSNFLGGRLRTTIVVGGSQMSDQRIDLRNGVEIVVATPGRLVDHLQQGNTNMARVSFVVLDEADRMLDMGFEPQIREVLGGLPVRHQTLLFSATMPEEVEVLAQKYLKNPVRVKVGQVSTPTANVAQHLEKTTDTTKIDALLTLLLEEQHQAEQHGQDFPLTIIFVERKNRADDVAAAIATVEGLSAAALHGGRSQQERCVRACVRAGLWKNDSMRAFCLSSLPTCAWTRAQLQRGNGHKPCCFTLISQENFPFVPYVSHAPQCPL